MIMPRFVDLEKLSYKCASLVKIGANHVELLLDIWCQYVSLFCTSRPEVVVIMTQFVDLEKLSYKCASLVKIGANHGELLLAAHTDISPWRKWVASSVFGDS